MDFDNSEEFSYLIADFSRDRNVKSNTIRVYIDKHMDEFEGHYKVINGKARVDEVGYGILSKKYPLIRQDTQVLELNPELQLALRKVTEQYNTLLEEKNAVDNKLIEAMQLITDQQNKQIEFANKYAEANDELKIKSEELARVEEQLRQKEMELSKLENAAESSKAELEQVRGMGFFSFRKWKKGGNENS